MRNTAKLIFAAFAAAAPVAAQEHRTKGTACPEFLGDKAEQGTFTLLSDIAPVTIQLNGGELDGVIASLSYDAVRFSKDGEDVEMSLNSDSLMKEAFANNVFGQDLSCIARHISFGGDSLLVSCEGTTINMSDTEVYVQMKEGTLRKAEKWCESSIALPALIQP